MFIGKIFYSLERNVRFFSRLQDLSLVTKTDLHTENVTALLKILAKNAIKISALKLDGFYSDYEPQLFHALICIIKSQEQLRKFSIVGGKFLEDFPKEYHGVISALESQNKSLREVTIMRCTCSAEFKVLMNCKNLEILRINDCDDVDILEANINTLELTSYMIDASSIVQILKKSGTLLQRLSLFSTDEPTWEISLLLETIKSFCPNITYLNISDVEFSTQFLEIIGNLRKLQYLTLCDIFEILDDEPEILVMQFAKLLPLTLQYLDLRYTCLSSYIDRLLNNCYAPLKYLLIDRLDDKKKAKALIEFCIRKGSLKYVGVEKRLNLDDNIKKEVEGCVTLISCERIVVNC
ncbi:hypothetical protein F8M41_000756 [Gigaspora margarita]|uniref:Uncharacterized protein n=1 Tax=Gigaspora margarita TaxID=4874 RepID=A0A8H4ESW3_GIGMA|nr:hypothetical protein F8M41_000756 [Gigaspora margarita]